MKNIKEQIKEVLRKYFETDDNGNPNKNFNEYFTAQEAIDEIRDIVGGI